MGRESLCFVGRRCSFVFALLATAIVAGCNRTPGYSDDVLLKQVGPLGTSALLPFDVEEFNVTDARADGENDYVYELALKGKFQQTLYALVDSNALSDHGFAHSPQAELEQLRTAMPGKHAELEKKFQQVAPGGGYYVLLCKQGEPCAMNGQVRAKKTDGEWKCTSISMTAPAGSRGAGLRYVSVDGNWKNPPQFTVNDPNQMLRHRMFLTTSGERATLIGELPSGAAAVDIDSPTFNERAVALRTILDELKQSSRQVRETTEQAGGEMYQRLRELANSAWTFEADTLAGKKRLQLEAEDWGSDDGESALFDVASPMRRQSYQLKLVRESGVRTNVGGVMVERMCWEGRAGGDQPDALLGTEHGEIDPRDRPAAYKLFVEKEGYSIEFDGKSFPLTSAKPRGMVKRLHGVHPSVQPIKFNTVWTGTATDEAGKSRPVTARFPNGFNGNGQSMRLEYGPDASVTISLYYINTETNGWYANGVLLKDEPLPANAAAGDLEHLKSGLRFEVPEKDRWVGYSRDGKYSYEFTVR